MNSKTDLKIYFYFVISSAALMLLFGRIALSPISGDYGSAIKNAYAVCDAKSSFCILSDTCFYETTHGKY